MAYQVTKGEFLEALERFHSKQPVPQGAVRRDVMDGWFVNWEVSIRVACSVTVHYDNYNGLKAEVSWASSMWTVTEAAANLVIYRAAVDYALIVQAFLNQFEIVETPN